MFKNRNIYQACKRQVAIGFQFAERKQVLVRWTCILKFLCETCRNLDDGFGFFYPSHYKTTSLGDYEVVELDISRTVLYVFVCFKIKIIQISFPMRDKIMTNYGHLKIYLRKHGGWFLVSVDGHRVLYFLSGFFLSL